MKTIIDAKAKAIELINIAVAQLEIREDDEGLEQPCDYLLADIAKHPRVCGTESADSFINMHVYNFDVSIPMNGERWVEMGHQYSSKKQWYPEV